MRPRWITMAVLLVVILAIGAAPILSVIVASLIAQANDCVLHEGFANPCMIGGEDWGETLAGMFVAGWFSLLTIPVAGIALAVWVAFAIAMALSGGKRNPDA